MIIGLIVPGDSPPFVIGILPAIVYRKGGGKAGWKEVGI